MELRHLRYFLAVADTASFTLAAKRLQVVQSGVSATIKALERELGVSLFVRGLTGARLTPAGLALRPYARATVDAARAAKDAVGALSGTVQGPVSLGTLTSITVIDLPAVLVELRARHPDVAVRLRTAATGSAGLLQQLRDGELDAAFLVFTGEPPADLHARCVASTSLVLTVAVDHPLASRGAVPLSELAGMAFVDGPRGYGNRTVVDEAFAAADLDRNVTLEVADVGTAAAYIRNGLGVGFLSQFILDAVGGAGLATVRISDCDLRWRLHLATLAARGASAATSALLSLIDVVGEV